MYLSCIMDQSELISPQCVVSTVLSRGLALIVWMCDTMFVELLQQRVICRITRSQALVVYICHHAFIGLCVCVCVCVCVSKSIGHDI